MLRKLQNWYLILAILTFFSSLTNLWILTMVRKRYIKFAASVMSLVIDMLLFAICLYSIDILKEVNDNHAANVENQQ